MFYNSLNKNVFKNHFSFHLIFLNFLNLLLILTFIFISPFDFECDSATALNYSKFFIQHFFNSDVVGSPSHRPFLYPLYILLSGTFIFDSLIPITILNSALSVIEVNLIYLTFRYIGKNLSLIFTCLLMLGGFFHIHINSFYETHLVLFFIILSICGLVNFKNTGKSRYFYLAFFSLFCSFFSRFDTFFILFLGLISLIIIVLKQKDFNEKEKKFYLFFVFICSLTITVFWAFYKSFFLYMVGTEADRGKKDLFVESFFSLSVNHYTGQQLFWRMNNFDRHVLNNYFGNTNNKEKYLKNTLNINSGKNSILLYETLNQIITSKRSLQLINGYKGKMQPLGLEKKYGKNVWERHYGDIYTNPEKVVNQIFDPDFESIHYPDQIPNILKENIGTKKGDELLKKVYFEFKKEYPILNKAILTDILHAYSIRFDYFEDSFGFMSYIPSGVLWYDIGFNLGNCAKSLFSENMYDYYEKKYTKSSHNINLNSQNNEDKYFLSIQGIKSFLEKYRFFSKLILGTLSLFMILSIFIFKEWVLIFFINFSYLLSNSLVSFFVSTNGKMTVYFLPILFFNLFFLFHRKKLLR